MFRAFLGALQRLLGGPFWFMNLEGLGFRVGVECSGFKMPGLRLYGFMGL